MISEPPLPHLNGKFNKAKAKMSEPALYLLILLVMVAVVVALMLVSVRHATVY